MVYALHALKIVTGAVTVLVMHGFITNNNYLDETLILGTVFTLGLFLMAHGLLTGIEAAVEAGNPSLEESQSAE